MAITKFSGNFDSDLIIKNWEMRQNERFKYVKLNNNIHLFIFKVIKMCFVYLKKIFFYNKNRIWTK